MKELCLVFIVSVVAMLLASLSHSIETKTMQHWANHFDALNQDAGRL